MKLNKNETELLSYTSNFDRKIILQLQKLLLPKRFGYHSSYFWEITKKYRRNILLRYYFAHWKYQLLKYSSGNNGVFDFESK